MTFRSDLAAAALGLAAALPLSTAALAQQSATPGRSKTVLVDTDYPGNGHKTQIVRVLTPARSKAPLHIHPGIESGYIVRGGGTLYIEGQPPKALKPGTTALVPPNTPHWFQNGAAETEIVTTYVLETGKPATTNLNR